MYREQIARLIKEKGLTHKKLAELSGISVDTLTRITHPKNPEKDSPSVNTLEDVCDALGVSLWEIFFPGDTDLIRMQAELDVLRAERDGLLAINSVQKLTIEEQHKMIDGLKDQIIETHNYYIKQKTNS